MQKELKDEEFLEYITMSMSWAMFPTGRPNRVHISGISLNYAFIGAAKGRQRKGCLKNIEKVSLSKTRLYWNARSQGKKVVGLLRGDNCSEWVVPKEWIVPDESQEEMRIAAPVYEETRCEKLADQLDMQCTKFDADYKSLVSFLGSLRGAQGLQLEESNELCVKCLFLFYPSLINEFCNDLMHWCGNSAMNEHEYAQISVVLNIFKEYLELLKGLKPLGKGDLSPGEIINVLNQHHLQVLSFKMENELKDSVSKGVFTGCLTRNVGRGIRSTYSVDNFELDIDQNIRGGKELQQVLWDVKKLAESIREM